MQTLTKNPLKKSLLTAIITLVLIVTPIFAQIAQAGFVGCVLDGKNVGGCLEESSQGPQTSFTEFTGGLTPPSTEGYSEGLVQATTARTFILNVTNFALGFLGLLAILIVIYGGFLYLTAAGVEEQSGKGKKTIMYAVIGLLIILGSFAIVNTVLQAPSGVETRGTAEEGTATETAGFGSGITLKFNNLAPRVETMATDVVTAYIFYFEAKSDLAKIDNKIIAAIAAIESCATAPADCQVGTFDATVSAQLVLFSTSLNSAIADLQNLKNKLSNNPILSASFESLIDDYIDLLKTAITESNNNARTTQRSIVPASPPTSGSGSTGSGPVTKPGEPAVDPSSSSSNTSTAPSAPVEPTDEEKTTVYESMLEGDWIGERIALQGKLVISLGEYFATLINQVKYQVKDIYDQVAPVTDAANPIFYALVNETSLKSVQPFSFQSGQLDDAGGLLNDLITAAYAQQGTEVPGDNTPAGTALNNVIGALVQLYTLLQNIQFVETRLTASTVTGNAPLVVNFSTVGSEDPSGLTIEDDQMEWDLVGDGLSNPKESPGTGSVGTAGPAFMNCDETVQSSVATCTYLKPGTYRVKVKIKASAQENSVTGKPYNEEIGPGISEITVNVNPPVTKINLYYEDTQGGDPIPELIPIISYNQSGFLQIDRPSIVVPLSVARDVGIAFTAEDTETTPGTKLTSEANEGATVMWDFGVDAIYTDNKVIQSAVNNSLKAQPRFPDLGSYTALLEVKNKDGQIDRKIFSIKVSTVVPQISVSPSEVKVGEPLTFDGSDSYSDAGMIDSYQWTGNFSVPSADADKPTFDYTFDSPGTYNATLTVTNDLGDSEDTSVTVYVTSEPPIAQFSNDFPFKSDPGLMQLDGTLSYDPDNQTIDYEWQVDGSPIDKLDPTAVEFVGYTQGDQAKPALRFVKKGTYNVSLIVSEQQGDNVSEEFSKAITVDSVLGVDLEIQSASGKRAAILEQDATLGVLIAPIYFFMESEQAVAYELDFGDGEVAVGDFPQQMPIVHNYTDAGTFIATATVFDEEDVENTASRKVLIGSSDVPVAVIGLTVNGEYFAIDPGEDIIANRKDAITFDAGGSINTDGTGRRISYSWDLGNGQRSTKQQVTTTYSDTGTYTVSLVVRDTQDPAKISQREEVDIKIAGTPPILKSLTAVPVSTNLLTPVTVKLNAVGAADPDGQITRYRWWYYDPKNDTDELGVQVTAQPTVNITIGTRGRADESKEYKFAVEITDDENNTISSRDLIDENRAPTLTVINGPNDAPIASFTIDKTSIFVGESINFASSSSDPDGQITAYYWDFEGDGFSNNTDNLGPNVSHTFTEAAPNGIPIRLKVRDNNESETTSSPVTVYVDSLAQAPVAAYTFEQQGETETVKFTNLSTADEANKLSIVKWAWDFDVSKDSNGDGKSDNDLESTDASPTYTFPKFGIYRTKLTVEDNEGKKSEITQFINVKPPVVVPPTTTPTTPVTPVTPPVVSNIEARLLTTPQPSFSDSKVHIKGSSGNVTFDYSTSVGDITKYTIDKNIFFDTNGNGIKNDDEDHTDTKPGKWITNFDSSYNNIRVRLTVEDAKGNDDYVDIDIVFDPVADATFMASIMNTGTLDSLAIFVSLAGCGILLLSLTRHKTKKSNGKSK